MASRRRRSCCFGGARSETGPLPGAADAFPCFLRFCTKPTKNKLVFPIRDIVDTLCRIDENTAIINAKWRIRRFWESAGFGIEIACFLLYNIHITQIGFSAKPICVPRLPPGRPPGAGSFDGGCNL